VLTSILIFIVLFLQVYCESEGINCFLVDASSLPPACQKQFPLPFVSWPGPTSPDTVANKNAISQIDYKFRPPLLLSGRLLQALGGTSDGKHYLTEQFRTSFESHLFSSDGMPGLAESKLVRDIDNIQRLLGSKADSKPSQPFPIDANLNLAVEKLLTPEASSVPSKVVHIETLNNAADSFYETVANYASKIVGGADIISDLLPPVQNQKTLHWPLDYPYGIQWTCNRVRREQFDKAVSLLSSEYSCDQLAGYFYDIVMQLLSDGVEKVALGVDVYDIVQSGLLFDPDHKQLRELQQYWRAGHFITSTKAQTFYYRNVFWVSDSVNRPDDYLAYGVGGGICDTPTVSKSTLFLDSRYLTGSDSYKFQLYGGVVPNLHQPMSGLFPSYLSGSLEVFKAADKVVSDLCQRRADKKTVVVIGPSIRHLEQLRFLLHRQAEIDPTIVGMEYDILKVNDDLWSEFMNCEAMLTHVLSRNCWNFASALAEGVMPWSSMEDNLNSEMPKEIDLVREVYKYAVNDTCVSNLTFLVDSRFASTLPLWISPLGSVDMVSLMVEPAAALYLLLIHPKNPLNVDDASKVLEQYFMLLLKSLRNVLANDAVRVSLIAHDPFRPFSELMDNIEAIYFNQNADIVNNAMWKYISEFDSIDEDYLDYTEVKPLLSLSIPLLMQDCHDALMMSYKNAESGPCADYASGFTQDIKM
jgi:hypothetical protein